LTESIISEIGNWAVIKFTVADDRLKILLTQLDSAWQMLEARLPGLTDDEYFWEPVARCWSIRRRSEARSPKVAGRGDWVMEYGAPQSETPPVTTIAWRICHIALWQRMRYDYTFGRHVLIPDEIAWPPTARDAVAFLQAGHAQWSSALEGVTTADLDQVGRSQMPYGLDPHVRFADLLAWTNTEFTHHAAEIACLRDLYRAGMNGAGANIDTHE
jgi:hypothetical protein